MAQSTNRHHRRSGRGERFNRGGGSQRNCGLYRHSISNNISNIKVTNTTIHEAHNNQSLFSFLPSFDIFNATVNFTRYAMMGYTNHKAIKRTNENVSSEKDCVRMVLDSGCTQHITNIPHTFLHNIKRQAIAIGTAGQSSILSRIQGDLNSFLRNICHCSEASHNLCSVGQLCNDNKTIVFESQRAVIYESNSFQCCGTQILEGVKRPQGYYTVDIPLTWKTEHAFAAHAEIVNNCTRWHNALGHMNIKAMRKIKEFYKEFGSNEVQWTKEEETAHLQQICVGCANGKLHKQPTFSTSTNGSQGKNYIVDQPGSLILIDLFFSNIESHRGKQMVGMLIVDAFSRCVFIKTMTHKSEAADKLNEWILEMKSRGVIFKHAGSVRTDNGTEFKSNFKDVLLQHNINLEHVPPYTHVHTAERHIGITKDNARAMIMSAEVNLTRAAKWISKGRSKNPFIFWVEAMQHAAMVSQFSPSSRNASKTKYELFFKQKPDLSRLKVFGCTAYPIYYNTLRKTWDATSSPGIYLGWNQSSPRTWRILRIESRSIVESDTVIFDQNPPQESLHCIPDYNDSTILNNVAVTVSDTLTFDQSDGINTQYHSVHVTPWEFNTFPSDSAIQVADTTSQAVAHPIEINDFGEEVIGQGDDYEPYWPVSAFLSNRLSIYDITYFAFLSSRKLLQSLFQSNPEDNAPVTIAEALTNDLWRQSLDKEISSLKKNKVLEIIKKPANVSPLDWNYIFKLKKEKKTGIKTYKARATLRGDRQKFGIDYDETFSPVARLKSLRMLLAMCATKDYEIHQMDVDTAFLNGVIEEDEPPVFVKLPHGFQSDIPNHLRGQEVCGKLLKTVYGLKQAPRNWNRVLNEHLISIGFKRSNSDPCIYKRLRDSREVILFVYVDDLIIAGNDMEQINIVKKELSDKWSMKDIGELSEILGMEVYRDRQRKLLTLSQTTYIKDILQKFGFANCKPISTPLDPGMKLSKHSTPMSQSETFPYREIIGSLMYLMVCTRPDISFAVGQLSKYNSNFGKEHVAGVKHLLRYLKGTENLGITFGGANPILRPVGFSDASYASDTDTRRSVTGYVFYYGGGPVTWKSKTQASVALSSFESEYMALGSAAPEAIHLHNLCQEIDSTYSKDNPIVIFEDNTACIAMTKNPVLHEKQKHIDVRYHYIRECVQRKAIEVKFIGTNIMLADLLTKPVAVAVSKNLRDSLMGSLDLAEHVKDYRHLEEFRMIGQSGVRSQQVPQGRN